MSRYRTDPDTLVRRLPDGILLLPPGADRAVALTGAGSRIWELLGEPCTREEVAARLAADFGTEPATVDRDLATVWRQLVEMGALVAAA